LDEGVDLWIENMWGNLLSSESYIANIFDKLNEDKDLGLLVPPEPIGKQLNAWYSNSWGSDYELTEEIVNRLNLSCKIDKNKPPITLSTAFWCKSDALRKLLSYDWKYDDFPEEPMANDGTISHSIERSLAFVAQDAGFKTGTVMTDQYASFMLAFLQVNIQNTFKLVENLNIRNFSDVDHWLNLLEFCKNNSRVYLYGSGKIGKMVLTRMRAFGIKVEGFVISNKTNELDEVEGMPVVEFATIKDYSGVGIIISVGVKLKNTIEKLLNDSGFTNYVYWNNDVE
jgi:rhamnosyltransferase